jgi:DNA-binding SARP family transcriptional activator
VTARGPGTMLSKTPKETVGASRVAATPPGVGSREGTGPLVRKLPDVENRVRPIARDHVGAMEVARAPQDGERVKKERPAQGRPYPAPDQPAPQGQEGIGASQERDAEQMLSDTSTSAPVSAALVFGLVVTLISAVLIRRVRLASASTAAEGNACDPPVSVPRGSSAGDTGGEAMRTRAPLDSAPVAGDPPSGGKASLAAVPCSGETPTRNPSHRESGPENPLQPTATAEQRAEATERSLAVAPSKALVVGQVFGVDRVQAGGQQVHFRRAEGRDLFAVLAACRDGELQEAVVERLWPDEGTRGIQRLEVGVRDINAVLREATGLSTAVKFVVKTGQRRHLPQAYFDIDLWRFEEAHRKASTVDDDGVRVQALREMIALYRGPLFADRDDLWCLPLRQAAASKAVNAVVRLAELERRRDPEHALDLLTLAVERIDPHNEVLWCEIMTVQGGLGRMTAVRRTFQQLTERLKEIDEQPSRQARRTYEQIIQ